MRKFYPNIKSVQLKVGIFTVAITLIFVFSYLWFTNRLTTRSHQDLRVSFENVAGLEVGDKVMFRGMEVGRVRAVEHKDERVIVSSRIRSDVHLKEGSIFSIDSSSLMGGMALNIIPGEGNTWLDLNKVQTGSPASGILNIVSQAGTAIKSLEDILHRLQEESGMIDKGERLIDDASSTIRNVDDKTDQLAADFSLTLKKLDKLSGNINSLIASNADSLNKSIGATPAAIAGLHDTLDSLRVLSAKVSQTMTKINSSTGTAGKLVNDDELYTKAIQSIENLDALVQDVKKNPKKYVKFSLF
ncbi:MAG: MlaD family protein [Candidatus Cloacimonadaceae bacterium]|jgi:phospholipid/cholesterol/gamma-HCH transport system substrate-binding protein